MRIVHVTDCYLPRLGGIELQVHDLALRQAAVHDVTVLTTTAGASEPDGNGRVRVVRVGRAGSDPERILYRRSASGVSELVGQESDLVHVHASSFSPLAFLAARDASRRGVPTVATVHSLWAKATPLFRAADWLAGWGDWPVVVSAVSNAAAASARSILAGRADVTVLPNGVDAGLWQVAHDGGRPDELRLAVVSRLAPRKRILPLLSMLRTVRDRVPAHVGMSVEILGEGPQRRQLERYLHRHGMDWVSLRGRCSRSQIRSVLARSDLFVAPAKLESFGIAALEARCAGLPIIALSATGVSDFVAHGREGWLVDSDSAMVDTIELLARAPEVLERVGLHNRSVPPAITWPQVLDRCEHLYRRAAMMHDRTWLAAAPAAPLAARLAARDGAHARRGSTTGPSAREADQVTSER